MATKKTTTPALDEVAPVETTIESVVIEKHDKGLNLYKIAEDVFGFQSDEAVARVLAIIEENQAKIEAEKEA